MAFSSRILLPLALVACGLAQAGCPDGAPPREDGSAVDQKLSPRDGQLNGEGAASSVVDFVVQGCAMQGSQCTGQAPLALIFAAVLPTEPRSASWNFGDGSPVESGLVVTHTYVEPGSYDVALTVKEDSGTTSELKPDFVVVERVGPGGVCSGDDHCLSGSCICQEQSEGCQYPLSEGLCLQKCEQYCPQKPYPTACVDLTYKDRGQAPEWRTRLCLKTCGSDPDCTRPGFSCRLAPGTSGWLRVCMPPFPRFVGDPCRTSAGSVDPSLCLGGICLDIGASGYCTGTCTAGSCPAGTDCVAFTAGASAGPVCLLRCSGSNCANDPLLQCEPPNDAGDFGFKLLGAQQPAAQYCSVKRCSSDSDCGLAGWCDPKVGGFCALKGI
jgi:PKD repeat protein